MAADSAMRTAPEALHRLASATHDLIEQTIRMVDESQGFAEDVEWAAQQIDAVRERLARHAKNEKLNLGGPTDPPDGRPYYVSGVIGGPYHPMTMPVEIETKDGVTTGRVNLDIVWEGPPGCLHGGYVAHLFDGILGQHNLNVGIPGMTGTLSVRYRQPTPLLTDLRFEVRTGDTDGRKITTRGQLFHGDTVCAEAEGIFIVPDALPGGVRIPKE